MRTAKIGPDLKVYLLLKIAVSFLRNKLLWKQIHEVNPCIVSNPLCSRPLGKYVQEFCYQVHVVASKS